MAQYKPVETEKKWQDRWEKDDRYRIDLTDESKPKYYNLVMFPYPSGDRLHIGHWYNFAPADSFGRYMRMKGYNVFEPMGFDAFGLPAENHAIKTGTPPPESTAKNTKTMVDQLKKIGTMYDWSKTLNTSEPEYYKWTQWLFLQMFKHKLAYKKEATVNWCPNCQTVLANEQAQDGTCERCATEVIQKPLAQWFWKITDYAQRLLDGLEKIDWPEKTKLMQKNWIGRSEGAEVVFKIEGHKEVLTVYTTRIDTLFSGTFMVMAPEHELVDQITTPEQKKEVEAYRKKASRLTDLERSDLNTEKTGVFTGAYAINPASGERMPLWVSDFVIASYGSGAVFADAHDERDFEMAKKYGIPLKVSLRPKDDELWEQVQNLEVCYPDDGILVNSEQFDGMSSQEAREKITQWLSDQGKAKKKIQYRLRDWLLSRQRYWGAPIPIVYDPDGNPHPVPEEHLPWLLPTDTEFKPKGTSPLGQSAELKERTEKIFGKGWTPEIDTMDTFVCSSFYYLRYLADGDADGFVDPAVEKAWMPVDTYIGGPEHACMHLIYARFVMMALKDFGLVSHEEPFQRLVHQGLVTNQGAKMSKSKGNTVSPDEFVSFYGSDVFRMYLMFMGPFTDGGDWNDKGITGISRFVDRFYTFILSDGDVQDEAASLRAVHQAMKKVSADIEKMHFNTAIAAFMEFLNEVMKVGLSKENKMMVVRLIAPLAPHLAEELWEVLGGKGSVFDEQWPEYDESLTVSDTVTLAVQVNGKVRGEVEVPADISEEDAFKLAAENPNVEKHLKGGEVLKKIYIPGKLVSFVVRP